MFVPAFPIKFQSRLTTKPEGQGKNNYSAKGEMGEGEKEVRMI
jgi:hypothetical protein